MIHLPADAANEEACRLAALAELRVLDTLPEQVYDDLVLLAAQICGAPVALVSLVDDRRQWFKARLGLAASETHRELAFCAHAIAARDPLFIVADAAQDPRFSDNALVTGEPHIRFYAGAPIVMADGHAMGTVCVVDTVPRELTPAQLGALQALARQAAALLELRRQTHIAQDKSSAIERLSREAEAERRRGAQTLERASDLLQRMGALAKVGGWELEIETGAITWTDEVYRIHEVDRATPLALLANIEFYAPLSRPIIHAAVDNAIRHGTPYDLELEFVTAKGRALTVRTQGELVRRNGKAERLFGTFQDITERKAAEQVTIDAQRRLRTIADNVPAMIAHIDSEQRYRFLNEHVARLYGLELTAVIGRTVREVRGEATHATLAPHIAAALRGEPASFEYTELVNGRECRFQSNYVPDIDAAGAVRGFHALSFDITELHATQCQLEQLAHVDALTGLPNRRQFDARMVEAMGRARRSGQPMAVMFLDVDHFKAINDTLGHAGGDAVLGEFARRLKGCVRSTDTVARLAGDEFVVLVEGVAGTMELGRLADKVVACIRPRFRIADGGIDVTTSAGVAVYSGDEVRSAGDLLSLADAALYRAKRRGRDRFELA
jgi:diguanylate cyclase